MSPNDRIPTTWTTGSTEVFKTGTWRSALPRHGHAPSPCHLACPVNGEIAEWIGRARARDFRGAWELLTRHNPFPAIAGRVCHHPCEAACNRAGYDDPVAICKLERAVGDYALAQQWTFAKPEVARDKRVAVIGGGPSGLSAAFQLRRRGYAVTLFEAANELGGLLRHGIPPYRLPREVLDGEIARIVALGVEVRCGESVATPEAFERLGTEFDAVYVAIGAGRQKRLPGIDYTRPWAMTGAEYLARSNAGDPPALGARLVVIGGGSAAFDVARSARRNGHAVTILALEDEARMPAQREEIEEGLEEGITLIAGAMLGGVTDENGALALQCRRVRFEPGARRGEFTLDPIPGSEFPLDADAIVTAIGQDPDLAQLGPTIAGDGALLWTDHRQATSLANVYAGGDVASMARFVTEAVAMGQSAALQIDRLLREGENAERHGDGAEDQPPAPQPLAAVAELSTINTFYHPKVARAPDHRLAAGERLRGNDEVQLGAEMLEALAETGRCFSCGTCIHCDNCVLYCPDLAVKRDGDGYVVLTDYCKGCGLCVKECPTGSMRMIEEVR